LLRLKGARFVYVNEPDENSELREGAVKAMTGGDALSARGVYAKSTVEFEPTWVSFLPTNHKPIIKGSDNGIWRRLILLPFLRNFENDPNVTKDEKRGEKLEQEIPGVLAWAIRGVAAFLEAGIGIPESVRAAGVEYRQQMDLLADWLNECCDVGQGFSCGSGELWTSWEAYAKANGSITYIRSSAALGRRLDSRFPARKDGYGRMCRDGVKVRAPNDPFRS
jgi:P4 family phage/plasmid primase-like protien